MSRKATKDSEPIGAAELRRRAEDRLRASGPPTEQVRTVADARALVHELQVHQVELEMQNEELRRARMEAEEASEKYFDLFDFAPTAYFLWDRDGRILEINLAGAALLGLERSVASQKRFGQFVAAEFRGAFADFLVHVLATDAKQTCELIVQKEGSSVWVLVEGIAAQDRRGPKTLCRAAVIDITAQRRADELATANQALEAEMGVRKGAEDELRRERERLSLALESSGGATWGWDVETNRLDEWNARYRDLYGFGPDDPSTFERWLERIHPEDRERLKERTRAMVETLGDDVWNEEFRVLHPTRGVRWLCGLGRCYRDASGRAVRMTGVNQDVTERRQAQEVLRRSKEELEQLVTERTARLQELVGELEHFSYTLTHDLKAPLRAMGGFAEMMRMTCGEGTQTQAKEFLGRISTAAERMDHLIADALNYSRSVRQELPLEDVDAAALLRGMLDTYPELQPEKARIVVDGRLPVVLANEAGLTQCFSNLLENAVKFVKPGEKSDIRVWASQVPGHGKQAEWVRIWVEDKGIGIAKTMLPRVFDMFSRGSNDYEGTGIGLALVRKVVQRMGGKVGAESEDGKGSRFWFELKSGEAKLVFGQVGAPAAASGDGTVLYVEDEESDAMFMTMAFNNKGLQGKLRLVGTGRAAIDYLSGSGEFSDREKYPVPTLVLLDLNLPQVSGFGVLEWIRNNPDYARLPVVVFSSSTREDDRVKARELGANEFVAKPSSGLRFAEVAEGLKSKWLGRNPAA